MNTKIDVTDPRFKEMLDAFKSGFRKPAPARTDILERWLLHPGWDAYFGKSVSFKTAVLVAILTGQNVSEVAKRFKATRQAAHRHARQARKLFKIVNR